MGRKQHYVSRKYLKAWADDTKKKIWAKIISEDAVKIVSLMDVAQESYFYEIKKLDDKEIKYCESFARQFPPEFQVIAFDLLQYFRVDLSGVRTKDGESTLPKQHFEFIHSEIENLGSPLVDCKSIDDLKGLHYRVLDDSISFLCTQLFRTKKMKRALVDVMKSSPFESALFDKAFPYFSLLLSFQLALSIMPEAKYIFVKNNTDVPFITTDQPVINLLKDELDENGHVKELKLYYPISPTNAFIICVDSNMEVFSEREIDREEVVKLNTKMKQEAHNFIFANNESELNADLF